MKRRICVLLLVVMLALSLILCTGGMAEEKDFIVTVVSLADAFAKFENPDLYPERDIQLSELQEEIRSGQAPDLIITYGDIETLRGARSSDSRTIRTTPGFYRATGNDDVAASTIRFIATDSRIIETRGGIQTPVALNGETASFDPNGGLIISVNVISAFKKNSSRAFASDSRGH